MMSSGEIGCVTSHIKAMKHWLETSDSPYAVIMEDDCSLETVAYWNFTWKDFLGNAPYAWDVLQLRSFALEILCSDSQSICE